jgi:hypothetical protein
MTDDQFLAWLKSQGKLHTVLIEATARVDGVETTMHMATIPYNTSPGDLPANTRYQPIASVGVLFTEVLSLTGDGALSAGEIDIENFNGARDAWLDYVWTNRPIRAYIGDVRWPRADFRLIFDGIVADIAPRGADKLALKLRDKLQRLNVSVSEDKLGGAGANADALLPLAFGECHNVTPLLVDPANYTYQVHAGPIERVIEVRDNAIPLEEAAVTVDAAAGRFTLKNKPAGTVTASVQGDKSGVYRSTITQLVQRLVTGYGKPEDRFTDDDLDLAALAAFDAAHPQPVALYLSERVNVLTACQQLAGSVGAQLSMTGLGRLRLVQVALPAGGTPRVIRPAQVVERSLVPVSRTDAVAAVKLAYCKEWTVQTGLVTTIPEEHKNLFETEWLTVTRGDDAVRAARKLQGEPVQQETLLLCRADAEDEAQRRLEFWKTPRTTYEFEGLPELLTLQLGDAVTVYYGRYGMNNGVTGMVISRAPDWDTGHVKIGFIV